jgi:Zn ribbon nucleic-acid-binding protein
MFQVAKTPRDRVHDRMAQVDWPDGPVCPFCGTREHMSPEIDGTHVRVRYECVQCGRHHGYIRRRMPDADFPSTRRQVLPRDPDGAL